MTINENLSEREMHREKKRNDFKRWTFARMYSKETTFDVDYAELEAKAAKTAELTVKPVENVQNDSEATTGSSLRDYINLLNKHRKLDPNQAFKEHKAEKRGEMSLEDIINTLDTT